MQEAGKNTPVEVSATSEADKVFLSKLSRMLYKSFEFSQGVWLYQHYAFQYVRAIRPEWEISDTQFHILKEMLMKKVAARFQKYNTAKDGAISIGKNSNHPTLRNGDNDENMNKVLSEAVSAFRSEPDKEQVLERITMITLKQDIHYLILQKGRPRRAGAENNPRTEPWMSHIHFFIGQQYQDSDSEFAHMFSEIREMIRERIISGEYSIDKNIDIRAELKKMEAEQAAYRKSVVFPAPDVMLSMLAQRWEQRHPGRDFFEPFDIPPGIITERKERSMFDRMRKILKENIL